MPSCRSIDPLITPYVDGELASGERVHVDEHLQRCPPCHARVSAERAVRDLLRTRREGLAAEAAPDALRASCAGLASRGKTGVRPLFVRAAKPLALAATVVLVVGGAFLYRGDGSGRILAAELTADHVKCFTLDDLGLNPHETAPVVERSMASEFGWHVQSIPDGSAAVPLDLVGARRCLYAHGVVAHLMYRLAGRPVSVFMLPSTRHAQEIVEALGHEAAIWTEGDRTFVLVAKGSPTEVQQLAEYVRTTLR